MAVHQIILNGNQKLRILIYLHRTLKQITDVIVHDIFSPPVAARIYAYSSIAAYETAINQDSKYKGLAVQLTGLTIKMGDKSTNYFVTRNGKSMVGYTKSKIK